MNEEIINPTELLALINNEPALRKALMKTMIKYKLDTYEAIDKTVKVGRKVIEQEAKLKHE